MEFTFEILEYHTDNSILVRYTSSNPDHTVVTKRIKLPVETIEGGDASTMREMILSTAPVPQWREQDRVAALETTVTTEWINGLFTEQQKTLTDAEIEVAFPTTPPEDDPIPEV